MDPMRPEQEALWRLVRTAGPPPDARVRVLERIEAEAMTPRSRRPVVWGALAAAVAALLVVWSVRGGADGTVRVVAVQGGAQGSTALAANTELSPDEVTISATGHLDLALPGARVKVAGPARLVVDAKLVTVREGALAIDGQALVQGPACTASVDGRCRVAAAEAHTVVTIFAGTVEATDGAGCRVIHADEHELAQAEDGAVADRVAVGQAVVGPMDEGTQAEDEGVASAGADSRSADSVGDELGRAEQSVVAAGRNRSNRGANRNPTPSELARQVAAFERAVDGAERDPAGALSKLRKFRRDWPRSPLVQEADLAIFEALVRLGRGDAARRAGRTFLRRYPRSPRADEVRTSLRQAGADDD